MDELDDFFELHRMQWLAARERAEEVVRDEGMSEEDDDFALQLEMETRRQWEEENERRLQKELLWGE